MRSFVAVVVLLSAGWADPLSAATPDQVEQSIRRGVNFLYARQKDGTWEQSRVRQPNPAPPAPSNQHVVTGGQWGGLTSIATYALLACGEKPLDPRIVQAVDFLRGADVIGNYALAMRAQVWLLLPRTDANQKAMLRDAQLLLRGLSTAGANRGFYDYLAGGTRTDLSVSQYGVLGMWAAADFLAEVPDGYWREVENAWLRMQDRETGGWGYAGRISPEYPVTPSITAAGVATLFITQEFLYPNQGLDCRGNLSNPGMQAIDRGLAYMVKALPGLVGQPPVEGHVNRVPEHNLYTMYGIERIGVASGYKYFGNLDWYQVGADFLVKTQRPDGSWGSVPDTCFALLFLSRGRAPVMMNKVRYSHAPAQPNARVPEAPWNQRPRDAANVSRWVGKQSERTLNWQIIDLDVATVRDLHDAPILYLAGSQELRLSADAKQKIKSFIEQGGLVFANADCTNRAFINSFRALANELYPTYEMRPLPASHPIISGQNYPLAEAGRRIELLGVSNGVRELMLLASAGDPARSWQRRDTSRVEQFQLAANVYFYAIDKTSSLFKGQTYLVEPSKAVVPTRTVSVGRLKYAGNWDPEPGGWPRLAAVLHNQDKVEASVRVVDLAAEDIPADVQVAHLTGTTAFRLEAAQREKIRQFVARGGLLVIDSAGGGGEFNTAAEAELAAIVPDLGDSLRDPLPEAHPLYVTPTPMPPVEYRLFARGKVVGSMSVPRLRGAERDGKLVVVFSGEDLSGGLVGQPVDGVIGYSPATATELMRRLLLTRAVAK
jgi:hypothetical protein